MIYLSYNKYIVHEGGYSMAFLDRLGKTLTETAKTVSKKSEELVEQTKLNLAIGNEEDKIKKLCEELGSQIYKEYKNGTSFGIQFDERCNFIKQCELNIEDLKNKIQGLKTASTASNESPTAAPASTSTPESTDSTDYTIKPQ